MKRRALLLSGGITQEKDRPRYANDVEAFHRLLVEDYGYAGADIRVCMSRGQRSPLSPGVAMLPATREAVLESLSWLAELGKEDRALLMVTDHGDLEGISLWGKGSFLSPSDIMSKLEGSAADKILIFGQCYAGLFRAVRVPRVVTCCACSDDEHSLPQPVPRGVEPQYDEFLYQLAGALAGRYPDGKPLPEGDPSLAQPPTIGAAFRFARDHDHWVTGTQPRSELPRIFDPEGLAEQLTL